MTPSATFVVICIEVPIRRRLSDNNRNHAVVNMHYFKLALDGR